MHTHTQEAGGRSVHTHTHTHTHTGGRYWSPKLKPVFEAVAVDFDRGGSQAFGLGVEEVSFLTGGASFLECREKACGDADLGVGAAAFEQDEGDHGWQALQAGQQHAQIGEDRMCGCGSGAGRSPLLCVSCLEILLT